LDKFNHGSKVRIIYIGGVEHNGSTFLGAVLGNHPDIECVGELTSLARQGWLGQEYCACGQPIAECSFWEAVQNRWVDLTGRDPQLLVDLESDFDRHRRFFRLFKEERFPSNRFHDYADQTYTLFLAIQQISEKKIIADTSKRFSRALALSMIPDIDLRIIHLVRDARGVAYSWSKPSRPKQRSWLDSSFRWNVTNLAFEIVKKKVESSCWMRLRYEDLIKEPFDTVRRIGEFVDVDLIDLAKSLSQGKMLNTYHVGVGNGFLRREKQVKLSSNIDWPNRIPEVDQQKVWKVTSSLMRHYGYSR
jgi:Sulfotransferase family